MSRKMGPLKFSFRGIVWWKVTGENRLYKNTSASKQNFTQSQRNHMAIKWAIYVPCCNFYRLVLFSVRRSGAAERLNHYLCGKRNNWQGCLGCFKNRNKHSTCSCWESEDKDDRCSRSHVHTSSSVPQTHPALFSCDRKRHEWFFILSGSVWILYFDSERDLKAKWPDGTHDKETPTFPPDTVWRRADSLKYWANSAWEPAVWLQKGGTKMRVFFFFVSAQYRSLHTCSGNGDRWFVLHTVICKGEPQYSSSGAASLRMKLQKIHTGVFFFPNGGFESAAVTVT